MDIGLIGTEGRRSCRPSFSRSGSVSHGQGSKARIRLAAVHARRGDLNYRVSVNVQGGTPKLQLKKYCPRLRKRTVHKVKRK